MKRLVTICSFLVFFFSFSFAQKQWTLEECIQHAIDNNITIRQLGLQKEITEIELNTSRMNRLPNLNAGVGQNWNFGRLETEAGLYENTSQSNSNLSVSSSIPVFTGFRIPNEIERNKLELKAAIENMEKAKEDLALNVASLYLQVLFNKELLMISEEQLALSKEQIVKTKALVDAEKIAMSQLYDIEAQVANDEVSVIQASNNLKLSLLDLAQSLELQDFSKFDIASPVINDAITEYTNSVQSPPIIYNQALAVKPVIKEQEYRIQSAEKSLKIAQAGYLPTVDLGIGYGTNYFLYLKDGVNNASFSDQFNKNSHEYIRLNLNIPIFNRFSVRNQVRTARINIQNQELSLDNVKKTLFKEIQTAYLNATAAQEKYRASERAVKSTSESFKYAKERYEVGKFSVFELNESRTNYIRSRSEEIQTKYDYIFRAKILDFYKGIPIGL